ncbi:MAG: ABC transporter ATP-binding protein [Elusimicrobia bacterium]|nr:ABC transporter ATP-binding protein [Elusimicrobiota bacterium]
MLFDLKGVKRRFGAKTALDLPSLKLDEGRPVVFYGPNGSGKTTLLNLLAGLDKPCEGEVRFSGGPLDVTLVEQKPYLFNASLLENTVMGLRYRGVPRSRREALAEPLLKRLGLWDRRDRPCAGFSDGERRRAALARGLILGARALLLDEPMANLDRGYASVVEALITEEAGKPGRTVLTATHDLGQAFRMGADVVYLVEGHLSRVPLWNVFRCEVAASADASVRKALVAPSAEFIVSTEVLGPATVSIDPRDVLLSFQPIDSSALNCLKGRVESASMLGLEVDVVVSAGCRLHAFITPKSMARLGLKPGDEVYATFKASAVQVLG